MQKIMVLWTDRQNAQHGVHGEFETLREALISVGREDLLAEPPLIAGQEIKGDTLWQDYYVHGSLRGCSCKGDFIIFKHFNEAGFTKWAIFFKSRGPFNPKLPPL